MPADVVFDTVRPLFSGEFWNGLVPFLKAFGFVVTVFSFGGILIVIVRSRAIPVRQAPSTTRAISSTLRAQGDVRKQHIARGEWEDLIARLERQTEPRDYKAAIIEADALVDHVLRAYEYQGETMADRMRALEPGHMPSINMLWAAHKVRNDIAHDPRYIVSPREGAETLRRYKEALKDLGAL